MTSDFMRSGWIVMSGLRHDVRFAIRTLFTHRLSTTLVVLMLGIGLGVNTAVFTAAHAWLLNPYPYPDPDRLVTLEARHVQGHSGAHYRDVLDWRERSHAFEDVAIFWRENRVLAGVADAERVVCQITTAGAGRVLNVPPVVGRFFTAQEDTPAGDLVALVSYSAWQRYFGGRRDIVGTTAMLDGRPHTIIGVMPDRASLPQRTPPAFWLPLRANPAAPRGGQQYYEVLARLEPGVTLEQARADMAGVALALERENPASNAGWRVVVTPAQSSARERNAAAMTRLFVVAACLLLLVCANVAGVLCVRSVMRAKELAVRAALGASRWRLVRPLLLESLLLGVAGGGIGLLVAGWMLVAADKSLPNKGLAAMAQFEWPTLLFTAGAAILTALLFGTWPPIRISRVNLDVALKGPAMQADRALSRTHLLSGLVVAEVALAMALLVAGGLFTKDVVSLLRIDTGLTTDDVVALSLKLPRNRYASGEQRAAFAAQVIERLRGTAGIDAVAAIGELPMSGDMTGVKFRVDGVSPDPTGPSPGAHLNTSSPGYFAVLGIRLLDGRDFDNGDRPGTPPVVIVSESLAQRYIPDRRAVGERLDLYGRSYTVVGVVSSIRHDGPAYEPTAEIYRPLAQSPDAAISFVLRTTGHRTDVMSAIRQRMSEIDPLIAVDRLRTMEEVARDALLRPRLSAQALASFALFGLVLALTGLYGVVASSTEQRAREIAIRVSLGATSNQVLRHVLWHGVRLAAAGLVLGAPLAFAVSGVLRSALVATSTRDPIVFVLAPALLLLAAATATFIPARRAARITPVVALKSE